MYGEAKEQNYRPEDYVNTYFSMMRYWKTTKQPKLALQIQREMKDINIPIPDKVYHHLIRSVANGSDFDDKVTG